MCSKGTIRIPQKETYGVVTKIDFVVPERCHHTQSRGSVSVFAIWYPACTICYLCVRVLFQTYCVRDLNLCADRCEHTMRHTLWAIQVQVPRSRPRRSQIGRCFSPCMAPLGYSGSGTSVNKYKLSVSSRIYDLWAGLHLPMVPPLLGTYLRTSTTMYVYISWYCK